MLRHVIARGWRSHEGEKTITPRLRIRPRSMGDVFEWRKLWVSRWHWLWHWLKDGLWHYTFLFSHIVRFWNGGIGTLWLLKTGGTTSIWDNCGRKLSILPSGRDACHHVAIILLYLWRNAIVYCHWSLSWFPLSRRSLLPSSPKPLHCAIIISGIIIVPSLYVQSYSVPSSSCKSIIGGFAIVSFSTHLMMMLMMMRSYFSWHSNSSILTLCVVSILVAVLHIFNLVSWSK